MVNGSVWISGFKKKLIDFSLKCNTIYNIVSLLLHCIYLILPEDRLIRINHKLSSARGRIISQFFYNSFLIQVQKTKQLIKLFTLCIFYFCCCWLIILIMSNFVFNKLFFLYFSKKIKCIVTCIYKQQSCPFELFLVLLQF